MQRTKNTLHIRWKDAHMNSMHTHPTHGLLRRASAILLISAVMLGAHAQTASAQGEYIGTITLVPYNFAMVAYADCNGQLISISQNTALFSILGTTYGGNGLSTFALPNLNGRTPIGAGQGPGLTNRVLGETGGTETVTLTTAQIPAHTHIVSASSATGTDASPAGNFLAASAAGVPAYQPASNSVLFQPNAAAQSGNGQPHNNWQPYLGMKWVICISGVFPPRN